MTDDRPEPTSITWLLLSVIGTPWLIFISTSNALFLDNQADLGYTLWFLAPFGSAFVAFMALGCLLIQFFRHSPRLGPVLWAYYFSGPFFLAFIMLRGASYSVGYELFLLSVLSATFLVSTLLVRRMNPGRPARGWAWLGLLFMAVDVHAFMSRFEFSPDDSLRAGSATETASRAAKLPNIYHLLFDGYQGDIFQLTLTPELAQEFRGFSVFPKNTTSSGRTRVSIPSVFLGRSWNPSRPLDRYTYDAMASGESLLRRLSDAGYQTTAYLHKRFSFDPNLFDVVQYHHNYYRDDNVRRGLRRSSVFNYSWACRYLPRVIVRPILGDELIERFEARRLAPKAYVTGSYSTFGHLLANEEHFAATNRYTFAHLLLPHEPFVLDSECEYQGAVEPIEQFSCANRMIGDFLRRLKKLGRFDDSLILVHSDHGLNFVLDDDTLSSVAFNKSGVGWNSPRSKALLMLKPSGQAADTELAFSLAETSLLDIAPTILHSIGVTPGQDLEGLPLTPMPDVAGRRKRYYHYHTENRTHEVYRFVFEDDRLVFDSILGGALR